MSNGTKGIPENSSVVMPRLYCHDVRAEMEFCKTVFGAVELNCRPGPDGKAAHALLTIGPAMIMIEAEWPGFASRPPVPDGSSPVVIFVYVENVDAAMERAVAGGAKILVEAKNQFWGDRTGWVMDLAGHVWTIASRIEETTGQQRSDRWSGILEEQRKSGSADPEKAEKPR
jgi:PhnB protein